MSNLPVLVLVHAFPFGAAMWRGQVNAFSGWRVVAPPLPGFDGHPRLADPTIDGYARDLLATLDRAGIERAVFGGLSMGGYTIFGVLRQAPERVLGLILADTRTSVDSPDRRSARTRSIELARTQGAAAIAEEMIPNILGTTTRRRRPDVVEEVRSLITSQPADALADGLQAMMDRPDSAAVLDRVVVPTTIIVGDEDTVTPPSDAEFMHRRVLGSTLVTLPGTGHMANLEAPDAFNAAVRAFLEAFSAATERPRRGR
jgi:pimeloyl-ACP methyl ester carboxylesterase